MGGCECGSDAPSSAFAAPPPYLRDRVGVGRYNIGIAGQSGCGKSSLLNEILGEDLADTGSTECTLDPIEHALPLQDPRGHFQKFVEQLPILHQECVSEKLRRVTLWDLPGSGTRLHPVQSYVEDKGLKWFDFVVVIIGERVLDSDAVLIESLQSAKVQYFVCRSKLDMMLSSYLVKIKMQSLPHEQKKLFAMWGMDHIRKLIVSEIRESFAAFSGEVYLVFAPACTEVGPSTKVAFALTELQPAVDRMFMDVIHDRHGHDLSMFFKRSLYGIASRVAFDWFANRYGHDRSDTAMQTEHDNSECPDAVAENHESCSMNRPPSSYLSSMIMHLAGSGADLADSASQMTSMDVEEMGYIFVPRDGSQVSDETNTSWISVCMPTPPRSHLSSLISNMCAVRAPRPEPRCFVEDTIFHMYAGYFLLASDLKLGSLVNAADGASPLKVASVRKHEALQLIEMTTRDATLKVSPSHQVMTPTGPVRADLLVRGSAIQVIVGSDGGSSQDLVKVNVLDEKATVFEVTFKPDIPVAVFMRPPGTIVTRGHAKPKVNRRARMNRRGRNGQSGMDVSSIPDTAGDYQD